MRWAPLLFGCFSSHTRGGSFNATDFGNEAIHRVIDKNIDHLRSPAWLAGEVGGKAFFGYKGVVGEHLGWDHKGARDQSRSLEFFLGYTAPAGTPLPQASDLEALKAQVTVDLERLGNASWEARGVIRDVGSVNLPDFAKAANPTSVWDKTVTAINAGKQSTAVVMDALGERVLDAPGSSPDPVAQQSVKVVDKLLFAEEEYFKKKPANFGSAPSGGSRMGFGTIATVGIGIILAGYLGWRLLHSAKDSPSRDARQFSQSR